MCWVKSAFIAIKRSLSCLINSSVHQSWEILAFLCSILQKTRKGEGLHGGSFLSASPLLYFWGFAQIQSKSLWLELGWSSWRWGRAGIPSPAEAELGFPQESLCFADPREGFPEELGTVELHTWIPVLLYPPRKFFSLLYLWSLPPTLSFLSSLVSSISQSTI